MKYYKDFTPVEILDIALNAIATRWREFTTVDIIQYLQENKDTLLTHEQIIQITDKLIRDGYIISNVIKPHSSLHNTIIEQTIFIMTFEGDLLIEKGGYCQMQEDINLERYRLEIANSVAKRDSKITAWGSMIAAIGAIILIFWEILKVIHHNWAKIQSFFLASK